MAFTRAALQSYTREIAVHTGDLTPRAASAAIAATARRHIGEVQRSQGARSGGIVPDHTTLVDGRTGATLEAVKPEGAILIRWHYLAEAVIRTVEYLENNGPERSGEWKRAITTYVDDTPVARTESLPAYAAEAVVAVRTVYARRLEVGKDASGGPFVVQVQQHFVEQASIALRPTLRPLGWQPRFTFVRSEADQAAVRAAKARGDRAGARTAARAAMGYPAIVLRPLASAAL